MTPSSSATSRTVLSLSLDPEPLQSGEYAYKASSRTRTRPTPSNITQRRHCIRDLPNKTGITWHPLVKEVLNGTYLEHNVLGLAVVHELLALQKRCELNLVHCRHNMCCLEQLLQMTNSKIGDTNALQVPLQRRHLCVMQCWCSVGSCHAVRVSNWLMPCNCWPYAGTPVSATCRHRAGCTWHGYLLMSILQGLPCLCS